MIANASRKLSEFFASVGAMFMPPFPGLPLVLWCYFVFSYIALPHNQIWRGDLPDPDDYTYLTQTLDWIQGQGWFDNIQHRMSPPEGVAVHYTRLAEIPIAATILFFRAFHYSWHGAALLASFLLPVLYLGAFFAALRWTASRICNPAWSNLTSFIALFGAVLMFKFAPGQVDHHGLEAILITVSLGASARMFARPDHMRWAILNGFTLALATAIALEVLPWMVLSSAFIGLWGCATGKQSARAVVAFAATLVFSSAAFLVALKPTTEILFPDLLAYSIAYVDLAAGIFVSLLVVAALSYIQRVRLRFILGGAVSLAIAALYLWLFPDLLSGPYGAMDKKLADLFFANLQEAEAMIRRYSIYKTCLTLATPLIALAMCVERWRAPLPNPPREGEGILPRLRHDLSLTCEERWIWALLGAMLAASMALAALYQIRILLYVNLFAIIPLVVFVKHGWQWIATHRIGRPRFWSEIVLILLAGPLTALILPAVQDGRSFNTGMLLFPAQSFADTCPMSELEKVLNDPHFTAQGPLRLMNMIDQGPELLFRTPHQVMSAPYHTNVRGNLDALDFFSTQDAEKAHNIATRDGINLVVLCRDVPDFYLSGEGPHYVVLPNGEEKMRPNASMAGQLAAHQAPDWLREIHIEASNYLLFEVQ